jgi:hypothetical protein
MLINIASNQTYTMLFEYMVKYLPAQQVHCTWVTWFTSSYWSQTLGIINKYTLFLANITHTHNNVYTHENKDLSHDKLFCVLQIRTYFYMGVKECGNGMKSSL